MSSCTWSSSFSASPETISFEAAQWCPYDVGLFGVDCVSCDCIKWGYRKVDMNSREILLSGHSGPFNIQAISTSLHHSVEVVKSKWLHVRVGISSLEKMRTYSIEVLLVFLAVSVVHVALASSKHTGLSVPAIVARSGHFRTIFFLRRRLGQAYMYALGGHRSKAQFSLRRMHARAAVDAFLSVKGIQIENKNNPVRHFRRRQCSRACRQELHELKVGINYYKISKVPTRGTRCDLLGDCAPFRQEFMAGHLSDISWVHTSKAGRDVSRLCTMLLWCAIAAGSLLQ